MSSRLNERQLDDILQSLTDEFNYSGGDVHSSCAEILRIISAKLSNRQLDSALQCLKYAFKHKKRNIRDSCAEILQKIATQMNEQQITNVFEFLMDGFNGVNGDVRDLCAKALLTIVRQLNDRELYLLLNNFLPKLKKGHWDIRDKINPVLSEISDEMWKCVTIALLQKNEQMKDSRDNNEMELLAFGLLTYSPLIQFDCDSDDDNTINSNAFNTLRDCCNRQIIEWGFSIRQE
ncbi:hypothetical protein RFI_30533 [Reticulomyxa filosa]|uniref:Exportin-1 C-terminal domain-containing protein n=1 Tax=Reticulomyxa filosa TaxID=46433 RepID=X6LZW5_RETFI|nr:hypothetical protein RFI_30533 [Reticulomyxa filosa]|eukprot:ETO06861.1 hypothetical protein RFI_30533 [Reticulomyxa filosa]